MSDFSRAEVRKLALLSRLEFTDEQADAFAQQLTQILHYVGKLNALDTDGIAPTSHPLSLHSVMREDEARPSLPPEEALANAPEREAGCFRVPPIIQEM